MADRVLIDTSALYALVAPSDDFHSQAGSIYATLINVKAELYLTSYVLLETSSIAQRRLGFAVTKKLIEDITPITKVHWIDEHMHYQAWNLLASRDGVGPSLVDWTTILVARSLGGLVFTFDRHFEAEGLSVIPRNL